MIRPQPGFGFLLQRSQAAVIEPGPVDKIDLINRAQAQAGDEVGAPVAQAAVGREGVVLLEAVALSQKELTVEAFPGGEGVVEAVVDARTAVDAVEAGIAADREEVGVVEGDVDTVLIGDAPMIAS